MEQCNYHAKINASMQNGFFIYTDATDHLKKIDYMFIDETKDIEAQKAYFISLGYYPCIRVNDRPHIEDGNERMWKMTFKDGIVYKEHLQKKIGENFPTCTLDYDNVTEEYLKTVRTERGYSEREPSDYYFSSNERWSQDAKDWISFRDEVIGYSLSVQQNILDGNETASLDEFKKYFPRIQWTYK